MMPVCLSVISIVVVSTEVYMIYPRKRLANAAVISIVGQPPPNQHWSEPNQSSMLSIVDPFPCLIHRLLHFRILSYLVSRVSVS